MREMLFGNLEHLLCVLILAARLGDIVTTYLVTPRLKLEMNLIVRRLGWKFAFSSLALCLVPYYSVDISLIILVPSLLVSLPTQDRCGLRVPSVSSDRNNFSLRPHPTRECGMASRELRRPLVSSLLLAHSWSSSIRIRTSGHSGLVWASGPTL